MGRRINWPRNVHLKVELGDVVEVGNGGDKVVKVLFSFVFYTKVVDGKGESNGAGVVAP